MFSEKEIFQDFFIEGQMLQYCGPLFFSTSSELRPTNVRSNGTFGLVDTGPRKLLVTCAHVVEGFYEFRNAHPDARMGIVLGGGYPVELNIGQLVDIHPCCDLATFDMRPLIDHCSQREFYPLAKRLQVPLKPKDVLAFAGYPGVARATSAAGANFAYRFFGMHVADVSGSQIVADLAKTKSTRDGNPVEHGELEDNGGISGSPCYRLLKNGSLQLVAFVTSEALSLVRLRSALCIGADGKIIEQNN